MSDVSAQIAPLAKSFGGTNLLNLMASLERACGGKSDFPGTPLLDESALASSQHIVLLLLDGMGDRLLHRFGNPKGVLRSKHKGVLSSVFPTTTSAAISALMTAHPPGQHGVMAWHMHLPAGIYTTLLAQYRASPHRSRPSDNELFKSTPLFGRLGRDCYQIQPRYLVESPFSIRHRGKSRGLPANNLNELFGQIAHVTTGEKPTFSYAYWPELDATGHKHGVASSQWREALHRIERGIEALADRLAGRDVKLLVTADHGMVDAFSGRCETLADLPDLKACLEAPIAGEPRAAFCQVAREKLDDFDALCRDRYAEWMVSVPTDVAFDAGLFGPSPNNALQSRAGNRILLMQEKRTLVEVLPGEDLPAMIGVHGGLHPDEIDVPLICLDTA